MITRTFFRRAVLAVALAGVVVPAVAPLSGGMGWTSAARAADPLTVNRGPTVIWHGPRADRVVALTFDDGWSPTTLRRIYRILVRERVPATFFVTGVYVQRAPALWRQIAGAGFPLANHSYLHRDTRDLAPRLMARDLALTRDAVERATGRTMLPYYRPPYGARNPATDRRAAAAGFPYVVLWDTTGGDTGPHPTMASVVRDATAGRSGSIVLLHAGPAVTPRALPAIIARYRARGFRFVTLPELLGTPDGNVPTDPTSVATSAPPPSRSVDRPGADAGLGVDADPGGTDRPIPTRAPVAARPTGGHAVAPLGGGEPAAPAGPVPVADPSPPARDAAWARRDETPATVAVFTAALLGIVVAGAAVAGRRRRPEDDAAA